MWCQQPTDVNFPSQTQSQKATAPPIFITRITFPNLDIKLDYVTLFAPWKAQKNICSSLKMEDFGSEVHFLASVYLLVTCDTCICVSPTQKSGQVSFTFWHHE